MLVRNIPIKPGDRYLIPGDIHFDKQDDEALDISTRVARERGVNGVILIGDTFESSGISRHGRPARSFRFGAGTIKAEGNAARPHLAAWRALVESARRPERARVGGPKRKGPSAPSGKRAEDYVNPKLAAGGEEAGGLYVLTGNHEHWWNGVQDEYPGLVDTPWYELYGDIFDGWRIFEEHTALRLGPLLVAHGHRLRGSLARYSAASVLANYPGQNTLYGHTHRVDACTTPSQKYGEPVIHGAWTIGHMRNVPDTLKDTFLGPHADRHQQGFAIVSFHAVDGEIWFDVEQATIHRTLAGTPFAKVGGEVYF